MQFLALRSTIFPPLSNLLHPGQQKYAYSMLEKVMTGVWYSYTLTLNLTRGCFLEDPDSSA